MATALLQAEVRPGERSASAATLSTKLRVPTTASSFVPRPRLVEQLTHGLVRGVVLVTAPAGFGKTSLLADWAGNLGRPVGWLSVDDEDNAPARFWGHLVAAVRQALQRGRSAIGRPIAPIAANGATGVVETLINEVDSTGRDVVLVVDGYDQIRDASIGPGMARLLDRRPDGLRLVLAGRAEPELPIARLRATGHLSEIGAADLRLRDDEVAAVVRAAGLDLADETVRLLAMRTEGWVAGLQLACLALHGRDRQREPAAAFDARHRFVLDFLAEDVLDREPPEIRRFLRETSILDRVSGDLANAVTGRSDGQALLERIARANLFLVPLDDRRAWWRYHALFAELLRTRLLALEPDEVPRLHRAAARWYADHGLVDEAIRHRQPRQARVPGTPEIVSEREFEVLTLVAAGRANREIADELFITVDTVKRHVTHILAKLGAQNRTQAAARARRFGLLD